MAASIKSYAYYIKGNKLALVQRNSSDSNATGEDYHDFKSPTEAVTDGLEIQYSYAPWFEYNDDTLKKLTDASGVEVYIDSSIVSSVNLLTLTIEAANETATYVAGNYVFITGIGKWEGLHKIKSSSFSTDTTVVFETRVNGDIAKINTSGSVFYEVNALEDEDSEIQLSSFLTKAAVYYVKAKLAEDAGQLDLKEYFMKEYRKLLDRHEDSRVSGMRRLSGFGMSRK